jgi:hypothetical protein
MVNGKQSIRGSNGEYIGNANWNNGAANAQLIAAAPDLLESCKHLLACMELIDFQGDPACIRARAAIAKAIGEKS